MRWMIILAATAVLATGHASAQTITFSNATPAVTIKLQSGSQVSLSATGDLIAQCDAVDPQGCARLLAGNGGGGQCGAGAQFSEQLVVTAPGAGPYNPGSQVSLRSTVTGASVCLPSAVQRPENSAISIAGWTGSLLPAGNGQIAATVTMPSAASTTYRLSLTCFGSTGSATSQIDLATSAAAPPPPPPTCNGLPAPPFTTVTPGSTSYRAVDGVPNNREVAGFEALTSLAGNPLSPFPQTFHAGLLIDAVGVSRSVRFTVPGSPPSGGYSAEPFFGYADYPDGYSPALDAYVSITQCPGDFRVPALAQAGTSGDPTYAEGCRSYRTSRFTGTGFVNNAGIRYLVTADSNVQSTKDVCVLRPNASYFMNVIMIRPNGNRTLPDAATGGLCGLNPSCGLRVQSYP